LTWVVGVMAVLALALGPGAAGARSHRVKTKVVTDGLLTVGAQETLRVTHVPKQRRQRLAAVLNPPPTATICNVFPPIEFDLFSPCLQQPLNPVPGTPKLKRNKKGRASLTFVMPAAYEYIDLHDPTQSHPIYLVDGQTVQLDILEIFRSEPRTTVGDYAASSSVVVQVPPSPAT